MALMLSRSVFFHIPKTGGVWVRRAIAHAGIRTLEIGNAPVLDGNTHNRPKDVSLQGRFTFSFVRHPLDWYVSYWSYRMLEGLWKKGMLDACMSDDFDRFLRNALRRFPGYLSDFYEEYLGPPPGMLHFVGRTENLAADLVRALRLAGEDFDEERLLTTPRQNISAIRPICTPELRERVLRAEEKAMVRFGYR